MFHTVSAAMLARMRHLEEIDARDRADQTPQRKRLRQIPPETGRLLAILAASAPRGHALEIGTSAGYSALWLSLAFRDSNRPLMTFEIDEDKAALARETFHAAAIENDVELVVGDARAHLSNVTDIAFCFLDAEKDAYVECYRLLVPRMVPGAILAADNVISHRDQLQGFVDMVEDDPRVDSVVVPIGQGVLVCRIASERR